MTEVEKFTAKTGETDYDKIVMYLEDAEADILGYTGLKELPDALLKVKTDLAVIAYNRQGTEGESGRSEGGISRSFIEDIPENIKSQLNRYRRARVIGCN